MGSPSMSAVDMKRKAEKQQAQAAAPVSAFAARIARQQQQQQEEDDSATTANKALELESHGEPPSKKARHLVEEGSTALPVRGGDNAHKQHAPRGERKDARKNAKTPKSAGKVSGPESGSKEKLPEPHPVQDAEGQATSDVESELEQTDLVEGNNDDEIASINGDADGYESPADQEPVMLRDFPLSKARLNKKNIIYSNEHTLCVRITEKMNLALLGHYDLWVKRGVVSLMGAKLRPSPRVYRVYAPSTHSLPVIKCVAGVEGEAEIEFKSCHSGIYRLRDVSPLYQRIWNGKNTAADQFTLKGAPKNHRRTFSVMYTSAEDSLKRHLRPLHMEKQWSSSIKHLSQRGGGLRALVCGPKASGKSTFSRYLLNHLLSPAPQTEGAYSNTDGVALLDLDPGQPEFSPMGQIYLAHLRSPFFGPPFTHPSLDNPADGSIVRAHHIGSTSPKEDPDHYVLAAMDLMDRYRSLLVTYPQCPLIVNYPGWIFGLGLEVATWLVKSLWLSDVVYMSEKGPAEVVEPLGQAACERRIPLITLPSQPTDFVSRSSAQLRSMQIQSYFHKTHPAAVHHPMWLDTPTSRARPMLVDYAGPRQGIRGIMVMGSQIQPDLLHDVLDGSVVSIVAVESPNAIMGSEDADTPEPAANADVAKDKEADSDMDDSTELPSPKKPTATTAAAFSNARITPMDTYITRTADEDLPYLFVGSGSCSPLDPKVSHSLGLALVRSINTNSRKLELVTPVAGQQIAQAIEQSHGIVLVRGQLDNPNWAISEEYHAARAALQRHQRRVAQVRKSKHDERGKEEDDDGPVVVDAKQTARTTERLRGRLRRASQVPWMTVVEDDGKRHREVAQRERSLWKLRKKAYPGSDSE